MNLNSNLLTKRNIISDWDIRDDIDKSLLFDLRDTSDEKGDIHTYVSMNLKMALKFLSVIENTTPSDFLRGCILEKLNKFIKDNDRIPYYSNSLNNFVLLMNTEKIESKEEGMILWLM